MIVDISYPFTDLDKPAFYCKKGCGKLIRYCNAHQKLYEVAADNDTEILRQKNHRGNWKGGK